MNRWSSAAACILATVLIVPSCLRDEFWNVPSPAAKRDARPAPDYAAPARDAKTDAGKKAVPAARPAAGKKINEKTGEMEPAVNGVKQQLPDYAGEAASKGYFIPAAPIPGDPWFITSVGEDIITTVPTLTRGRIQGGVLSAAIIVPWRVASERVNVFLLNNGVITPVDLAAFPGKSIRHSIVVGRGANYLAVACMTEGRWVARTPVVLVDSEVRESLGRLELTWDGRGDLDLHLDVPARGGHVGYDNRVYDAGGYSIILDADNMDGYGPESVRIHSIPGPALVSCYVNYFSGSEKRRATVRHYDKNNRLVNTYTRDFTPAQVSGTPRFNEKSWLVDRINVGR
jgi:uncharacterized protein YfaP (DUF2135 family)